MPWDRKLELGRQPRPQVRERLAGHGLGVGDDQDQVAGPGIEPLAQLRPATGLGKNLAVGPVSSAASTFSQTSPLAPKLAGELGQAVQVLAAVPLRSAGTQMPRIRWPSSFACLKTLNSVCSARSPMSFISSP